MKKNNFITRFAYFSLPLFLIAPCSCDNTVRKNDFVGIYNIDKTIPLDSNLLYSVQKSSDWKLILSDSNNFQLYGTNKNIIGYWNVTNNGKEYQLLFQGGGVKTTARFNGYEIYFDKPNKLLDSLFSYVLFIKKERK